MSHQRNVVFDRRTRWKCGYNKAPKKQELHFHQLETLKTSSPSVPCLEITGAKGSVQTSWGTLASSGKDLANKPQKVLIQITKGNSTRTLAKSNLLPPIYSTRTSTTSMSSAKNYVQSWAVEYQELQLAKKDNILSTKALFSTQKQGCQLTATNQMVFNGLAVFNEMEHARNQDLVHRQVSVKTSDTPVTQAQSQSTGKPQGGLQDVEPSNLSANNRVGMTERMKDSSIVSKFRHAQPLSHSAIEIDSLSSQMKDNEKERNGMADNQEEYYTNQRIMAWIVNVNASLFSPSKDKITDRALEEEDVDTIKIIYGQE